MFMACIYIDMMMTKYILVDFDHRKAKKVNLDFDCLVNIEFSGVS